MQATKAKWAVWAALAAMIGLAACQKSEKTGAAKGGDTASFVSKVEEEARQTTRDVKEGGEKPQQLSLAQQGKSVYGQCVGCHGGTGLGVPSQFPPLAGSSFVVKGESDARRQGVTAQECL